MKVTKRQLKRIIKEELDIETQRAMDMGIIPYPDGTYAYDNDGALMDLDDYQSLESAVTKAIGNFVQMGYEKEDVIETLKLIIEDMK